MAHACNAGFLRGRDRRVAVWDHHGQKLETLSQKQADVVVHAYNPSYSVVKVRESQFEANPGKSFRPFLKNKLKAKGLGAWLKW
jgi:hypothetical protein